jgi:hypothetical protein
MSQWFERNKQTRIDLQTAGHDVILQYSGSQSERSCVLDEISAKINGMT